MVQVDPAGLLKILKQNFGYSSFRPLQQEIIADVLAGRDVFALLPTGGGKSLCYQLPALARPGLTVVVSPLIALMKDQVDAMQASGVAATFLNSTLETPVSRERYRGLARGEYRLLYLAPERLMLGSMLESLANWRVNLLAVDEAHCISEWGHDFRPEYRQLATLRERFPAVPIMALTATATPRVRDDIIVQLKLRDPRPYQASFNRPNLFYRVVPKNRAYDQLFEFLRMRRKESGIVYCQSRNTTERLAQRLQEDNIAARPYHAGMTAEDRARNQEKFLRDDVRVICATIAFGMGINKPNVRFVVHYDLPKNIEGYYQETGRAGRDGLRGECLLIFGAGDVVKYQKFIDEKPDPKERRMAKQQLEQVVHYAESAECRRSFLLGYFGEQLGKPNCGGCDNCLSPRQSYDGTLAAQKFLSCVYRIQQKSGFNVGLGHVTQVLTGADTDQVRKWGHQELSTYGIGREHARAEWSTIGRELLRLGYIVQLPEKFNVVQLTPAGMQVLKDRTRIPLTTQPKPTPSQPKSSQQPAARAGDLSCDETLFDQLRQLRKRLADDLGVPPYIVFSDVALRQMARVYPANDQELLGISGVGQKKLKQFGAAFLAEIAAYLGSHPRQVFADDLSAIS